MTEPKHPDDAPFEREVREAARGESERTPALVLGGVWLLIAAVVGIGLVIAFLIYYLV